MLKRSPHLIFIVAVFWAIQYAATFQLSPKIFSAATLQDHTWIEVYEHHFTQLVLALVLIGIFSRGRFAEWGLNEWLSNNLTIPTAQLT